MSELVGAGDSEATPAATVVPLRDGSDGLEVLLLRRSRRGAFAGMWVFPGGRVEPVDHEGAAHGGVVGEHGAAAELAVARRAAVREAKEEAAVALQPSDLAVFSWWLPPDEAARRYSTWFFLAPFTVGEQITVDQTEIHEHRWIRPSAALTARDAGDMALAPPTWMTLRSLAAHRDVVSAMATARARQPIYYITRAIIADGELVATVWEGDVAYEDPEIGLEAPGPRRRLVTSKDGWRFEGPFR